MLAGRTWAGTTDTVVLLFHGLGGSHDATYMNRAVVLSIARGHSIWAMNHRGCGEGRSLAKGTYHSGRADDIGAVIKAARQAHPGKRIAVIGFSLSGNALLLNLGDGIGVFEKPDVAIAVNPPIDLARCAVRLKTGFNRIYDLRFVIRCRRSVRERVEDGLIQDIYRIPRFCTLMDFDEFYTAPASGFRDRDDYYERCSAGPHLTNIQTPTVILMAEDDPFVAVESFREFKVSDSVHLHIESIGGHMGCTAENLVTQYKITRNEVDEFAVLSQERAIAGKDRLREEMVALNSTTFNAPGLNPRQSTNKFKLIWY